MTSTRAGPGAAPLVQPVAPTSDDISTLRPSYDEPARKPPGKRHANTTTGDAHCRPSGHQPAKPYGTAQTYMRYTVALIVYQFCFAPEIHLSYWWTLLAIVVAASIRLAQAEQLMSSHFGSDPKQAVRPTHGHNTDGRKKKTMKMTSEIADDTNLVSRMSLMACHMICRKFVLLLQKQHHNIGDYFCTCRTTLLRPQQRRAAHEQ